MRLRLVLTLATFTIFFPACPSEQRNNDNDDLTPAQSDGAALPDLIAVGTDGAISSPDLLTSPDLTPLGPFAITGITPINGAMDVALREPIVIDFTEPPAPASVSASGAITVTPPHPVTIEVVGSSVRITPSVPWPPGISFSTQIAASVASASGQTLAAGQSHRLTTRLALERRLDKGGLTQIQAMRTASSGDHVALVTTTEADDDVRTASVSVSFLVDDVWQTLDTRGFPAVGNGTPQLRALRFSEDGGSFLVIYAFDGALNARVYFDSGTGFGFASETTLTAQATDAQLISHGGIFAAIWIEGTDLVARTFDSSVGPSATWSTTTTVLSSVAAPFGSAEGEAGALVVAAPANDTATPFTLQAKAFKQGVWSSAVTKDVVGQPAAILATALPGSDSVFSVVSDAAAFGAHELLLFDLTPANPPTVRVPITTLSCSGQELFADALVTSGASEITLATRCSGGTTLWSWPITTGYGATTLVDLTDASTTFAPSPVLLTSTGAPLFATFVAARNGFSLDNATRLKFGRKLATGWDLIDASVPADRRLEDQLVLATRVESGGTAASGVAVWRDHDKDDSTIAAVRAVFTDTNPTTPAYNNVALTDGGSQVGEVAIGVAGDRFVVLASEETHILQRNQTNAGGLDTDELRAPRVDLPLEGNNLSIRSSLDGQVVVASWSQRFGEREGQHYAVRRGLTVFGEATPTNGVLWLVPEPSSVLTVRRTRNDGVVVERMTATGTSTPSRCGDSQLRVGESFSGAEISARGTILATTNSANGDIRFYRVNDAGECTAAPIFDVLPDGTTFLLVSTADYDLLLTRTSVSGWAAYKTTSQTWGGLGTVLGAQLQLLRPIATGNQVVVPYVEDDMVYAHVFDGTTWTLATSLYGEKIVPFSEPFAVAVNNGVVVSFADADSPAVAMAAIYQGSGWSTATTYLDASAFVSERYIPVITPDAKLRVLAMSSYDASMAAELSIATSDGSAVATPQAIGISRAANRGATLDILGGHLVIYSNDSFSGTAGFSLAQLEGSTWRDFVGTTEGRRTTILRNATSFVILGNKPTANNADGVFVTD